MFNNINISKWILANRKVDCGLCGLGLLSTTTCKQLRPVLCFVLLSFEYNGLKTADVRCRQRQTCLNLAALGLLFSSSAYPVYLEPNYDKQTLNLSIATFVIQKRNETFEVCICCLPQVKGFRDSCAFGSDVGKGFEFSKYLCFFSKGWQAKARNTGILIVM